MSWSGRCRARPRLPPPRCLCGPGPRGSYFQAALVWLPCHPAGYQARRRDTVLLDTGATHCFICARLAATLGLPPSAHPGPTSVTTAAPGGTQDLPAPVMAHLGLGDTFREALSVSPMDMDVGDDLILGCDWISSLICTSFTWTAASAYGRGLHSFRWTSCPQGRASRRAPCRLSATGSSPAPPPDRAGRP